MASAAADPVWYVYGVVADGGAPRSSAVVAGLDDVTVSVEREGELAALVSVLDSDRYGPNALESNSADVEWLGPRAVAHDRVLTWASEHGAVVPLPMFSVFSGSAAVHAMLRERRAQLVSALERVRDGREYALRVFRVDAELAPEIGSLSPRIRAIEEEAARAAPGQRYLLERKLERERKAEVNVVGQRIVAEIMDRVAPHTLDVARSHSPRVSASDEATAGTMVLNAAFLVAPAALVAFQRALTELVETHGGHGFRFDFTGPWPPYHFVAGPTDGG
jgi:hypothetical protein